MKAMSRRFLGIMLVLIVSVALLLFGLFRYLQDEENYSRIEDHLYLGGVVTAPPRGTRAVINLCEVEDPYRREFHLWEPIVDGEPAPDLDWLRRMVDVLDARQREGMTTYVHCRNGVSRSGMLVVAYEMRKNNWTRDEALAFARARRPITRPNPAFMRLLLEWERSIKGEPVTAPSAAPAH
jgi:hypothetical protein